MLQKDLADVAVYKERGLDYCDLARPVWRQTDPGTFYGFIGWCFNQYRDCEPHKGYRTLKKWCDGLGSGRSYVYTSNVDGNCNLM